MDESPEKELDRLMRMLTQGPDVELTDALIARITALEAKVALRKVESGGSYKFDYLDRRLIAARPLMMPNRRFVKNTLESAIGDVQRQEKARQLSAIKSIEYRHAEVDHRDSRHRRGYDRDDRYRDHRYRLDDRSDHRRSHGDHSNRDREWSLSRSSRHRGDSDYNHSQHKRGSSHTDDQRYESASPPRSTRRDDNHDGRRVQISDESTEYRPRALSINEDGSGKRSLRYRSEDSGSQNHTVGYDITNPINVSTPSSSPSTPLHRALPSTARSSLKRDRDEESELSPRSKHQARSFKSSRKDNSDRRSRKSDNSSPSPIKEFDRAKFVAAEAKSMSRIKRMKVRGRGGVGMRSNDYTPMIPTTDRVYFDKD